MLFAIDPGKDKTGVALVADDGTLIEKKVVRTDTFEAEITPLLEGKILSACVMGNGPRHQVMQKRMEQFLQDHGIDLPVTLVDEKYTTEMGEQWYWKDHPAKGFSRLIPKGMRTVPVPIDDYVAWIIGCIYLGIVKAEDVGHKKIRK